MNLGFFNISQMCAKIDFNRQPTQPTVIDLRDVSFIEPFAVFYLGMLLRHFNSNGVRESRAILLGSDCFNVSISMRIQFGMNN